MNAKLYILLSYIKTVHYNQNTISTLFFRLEMIATKLDIILFMSLTDIPKALEISAIILAICSFESLGYKTLSVGSQISSPYRASLELAI